MDTESRAISWLTEPLSTENSDRFALDCPNGFVIDPVQQRLMFVATSGNCIRRVDLSTGLHTGTDLDLDAADADSKYPVVRPFEANGIDMFASDGVLIATDGNTRSVYAILPKERALTTDANRFVSYCHSHGVFDSLPKELIHLIGQFWVTPGIV